MYHVLVHHTLMGNAVNLSSVKQQVSQWILLHHLWWEGWYPREEDGGGGGGGQRGRQRWLHLLSVMHATGNLIACLVMSNAG